MLFPDSAKKAVSAAFYDKEISVFAAGNARDKYGGAKKILGEKLGTLKGNVRFSQLGEAQAELGLTEEIDIIVTCASDEGVKVGDLIVYDYIIYAISSVIPSDSHLTIAGQKWATA